MAQNRFGKDASVRSSFFSIPMVAASLVMLPLSQATGCVSFDLFGEGEVERAAEAADQTPSAATHGSATAIRAPEPAASQRDVASLQAKVASQERAIATLRSELAVMKRGLKTGLFDAVDATFLATDGTNLLEGSPALDLGFADDPQGQSTLASADGQHLTAAAPKAAATPSNNQNNKSDEPNGLLESSIASIERQDYPNAIVTLTAMRERYPGFSDEGLSNVLMAESWNALKAPEKALAPLEQFLSVHASSRLVPRAKLAQAEAFASLGERQKSIQLLLEVISLAPETATADLARARLAALRAVR